jgi:tetratricopeptide (TPR) repeat protein
MKQPDPSLRNAIGFVALVLAALLLLGPACRAEVGGAAMANVGNVLLARAILGCPAPEDQAGLLHLEGPTRWLKWACDWVPESPSASRSLGRLYSVEGSWARAIGLLRRSASQSRNPLTYQALGKAYQAIGQHRLAIEFWAEVGQPLARFYLEKGIGDFEAGSLDKAARELEIALEIGGLAEQDRVRAHLRLAEMCHRERRLDEALWYLRRALAIAPDSGRLYESLGLTMLHMGNVDDAMLAAREAVLLDGELPGAHRELAAGYVERGMLAEAVSEYYRALQFSPHDVWALHGLGLAHCRLGRSEMAVTEWAMALLIDPGFEPARRAPGAYGPAHQEPVSREASTRAGCGGTAARARLGQEA